jgi:hypothetical protein
VGQLVYTGRSPRTRAARVKVDPAYLGCVKQDAREMIDGQIGYLEVDARRMHRLDHPVHIAAGRHCSRRRRWPAF